MANACLMLPVMTLDHCPSQGHCSFVFVVNFEQVLPFDCYSYFPDFSYHFCYLPFSYFITIVSKIISINVVIFISVFFVYPQSTLFVPSTCWWAFSMSSTTTLYCLFFISICFFLLTLSKYTLHRCKCSIL